MAEAAPVIGRVTAFDERLGLGVVTGSDGTELPFHCTRIADGSRAVDVGAEVAYLIVAGGPGRWEASGLVKLTSGLVTLN
jgi:cold shock CspA family protein